MFIIEFIHNTNECTKFSTKNVINNLDLNILSSLGMSSAADKIIASESDIIPFKRIGWVFELLFTIEIPATANRGGRR